MMKWPSDVPSDTPSQRVQFILGTEDGDEEHIPHDLFTELDELAFRDGQFQEWKETARWGQSLYFSCLLLYSSVMIFKFLRGPSCLPLLRTSPLHFSVPGTKSFFVQDKPLFVQGLSSECWRCSSRTSSGFYSDIFKSYNSCVSSLSSCFRAGVQLNCFRVMLTKTDLIWAQAWNKD